MISHIFLVGYRYHYVFCTKPKAQFNEDDLSDEINEEQRKRDRANERWALVRKKLTKILIMSKMSQWANEKKKQRQEEEAKEAVKKRYSMEPDNKIKLLWDVVMNSIYILSFFLYPLVVAF